MKNLFHKIMLISLATFFIMCSEDDGVSTREYPRVKTLGVTNITESGATFNAEFILRGDFEITSYGFVWSSFSQNPDLQDSERVEITGNITESGFSSDINSALIANDDYFVKAFVKTDAYTVYGQSIEFVSLGSDAPKIDEVSPLQIFYQDTIKISGSNFSFVKKNNFVQFGDVRAEVALATDTLLHVLVPDLIASVSSNVSVTVAGNIAESNQALTFKSPQISSVSNSEVVFGDTIKILGSYFGYKSTLNTVSIDGAEIEPVETDSTAVTIALPVTDKNFTISIANSLGQKVTTDEFTTLDPSLTQITPDEGYYGDVVTVLGQNFGNIEDIVEVYFNDQKATIDAFSNEEIKTTLPEGLNNPIVTKVIVNGIETSSSGFYYAGPELESFSPSNGTWGDLITITGNNFSEVPSENSITVGGISATVVSSTNEEILFTIPNDVDQKSFSIEIEVNGVNLSTSNFTLNDPIVSSISPTLSNDPASTITITGSNFHPVSNKNIVTFNNTSLAVNSSTSEEIVLELDSSLLKNELVSEFLEHPLTINNSIGVVSSENFILDYSAPFTEIANLNFGAVEEVYILNDEGYVVLDNTALWKFNFTSESWTQLATFPGIRGTDNKRHRGSGFVKDGLIYYGMGSNANEGCSPNPNLICPGKKINDFWKYDPNTNSWTQLNNSPLEGNHTHGFTSKGRSFIISDDGFYEYDDSSDEWTSRATIPEGFYSFSLFTADLNGNEVVCYITTTGATSFQVYDPSLESWTLLYSDPDLRYIEDIQTIGDHIYFTKLTFPQSSNDFVSQLFKLNSTTLELEEVQIPNDQITYLPFNHNEMLYLDGFTSSNQFYKYDPNFTPQTEPSTSNSNQRR